jgi:hypothetical protein
METIEPNRTFNKKVFAHLPRSRSSASLRPCVENRNITTTDLTPAALNGTNRQQTAPFLFFIAVNLSPLRPSTSTAIPPLPLSVTYGNQRKVTVTKIKNPT